ncbi:MAG: hypothetical protein RLP02_09520 [Coleofasciculus sp. C2-GNP5-27]
MTNSLDYCNFYHQLPHVAGDWSLSLMLPHSHLPDVPWHVSTTSSPPSLAKKRYRLKFNPIEGCIGAKHL